MSDEATPTTGEQVVSEWKLRSRNWTGFDLPDYQAKVLAELINAALAALDAAIAEAQQPLVDALAKLTKSIDALEGQEIEYSLGMQLAKDCVSAKAQLAKVKEGK